MRDGDTIEVGGLPIRLQGLAAPEDNEPGGAEAAQAMREMVQGRELRCELDGERTRCVGICYLDGQDISEIMVRRGLARIAPGSAAVGMLRQNTELLLAALRSAGHTRCPDTAGPGGDVVPQATRNDDRRFHHP